MNNIFDNHAWTKVEDSLPEYNVDVEVIVEGQLRRSSRLGLALERHLFVGKFNPRKGWQVWFCPDDNYQVIYWRKRDAKLASEMQVRTLEFSNKEPDKNED